MPPSSAFPVRAAPRPAARAWKRVRPWLYRLHRWIGIALCLLFATWFVSGVVMMYVPFPSFRAEERVATAPPIRWDLVRIRPDAVLALIGRDAFPDAMRLGMTGGEPVYRMAWGGERHAVSARTGAPGGPFDAGGAMRIAARFGGARAASATLVDRDQWVVTRAYRGMAPFWRVRLDDGRGTDIYVTRATGEIVQNTDTRERFWSWLGAVPHWLYFTALRVHQEPWRQTVMWASGIGIGGAILGCWIGILRLRVRRRYATGSVSPYRGWMRWHHLAGLAGGAFLVTWVFSGWLSMSPFGGLGGGGADIEQRYTGAERPRFAPTPLPVLARTAAGAAELRFEHVAGRPIVVALRQDGRAIALDAATAAPLRPTVAGIVADARHAVPDGRLTGVTRLTRPDRYWYATGDPRRDGRLLPVLRLAFDDPPRTWLYVDPATGRLLARSNDGRRTYRWLFSALHSFDLPLLLAARPVRDGLMILLSVAGLAISISGVVIGWRRLARGTGVRPARRMRPTGAGG